MDVKQLKQLAVPRMIHPKPNRRYLSLLGDYLTDTEMRELAFLMSVQFENFEGENKRETILNIVLELERQGRLYQFEELVREQRPNVEWPPFV